MDSGKSHPAKFSREVLDVISSWVPMDVEVLDPFAGVGYPLVEALPGRRVVGIEIEPEWALCHPGVRQGDALDLPFRAGEFAWSVTSPTYGNRMADSHIPREICKTCKGQGRWVEVDPASIHPDFVVPCGSFPQPIQTRDVNCPKCGGLGRNKYDRITYTHRLGRKLHENNSGAMQWGKKYREFHTSAWDELARVLDPDARPSGESYFILNISDHIRAGRVVPVTDWHLVALGEIGFRVQKRVEVATKRMRKGANAQARVDHESVILLVLPRGHRKPPEGSQ